MSAEHEHPKYIGIDTPNQQTPLEKAKVNDIDLGCSVPKEPVTVANEGSIQDLLNKYKKSWW